MKAKDYVAKFREFDSDLENASVELVLLVITDIAKTIEVKRAKVNRAIVGVLEEIKLKVKRAIEADSRIPRYILTIAIKEGFPALYTELTAMGWIKDRE